MSFVHLHVYSAYSLLQSTVHIEDLVREAKTKGFKAIALTDRNVMYGAVSFYKECLKHSIKPILGLTVDILSETSTEDAHPIILLAKNNEGFQNLLKISSAVQIKSPSGLPVKWLKHYSRGLYALTPGIHGEIETYIANGEPDKAEEAIEQYSSLFEDGHFYVSIQDFGNESERQMMKKLISLSKGKGVDIAITNHVQYLAQEDAFAHECLLAIKDGKKLQDEDRACLESDQHYLKSANEIVELFTEFPEALENTIKIANECLVELDLGQRNLPKFPTEPGISVDDQLEDLCMKGLKERYSNPTDVHLNRLTYELSVIKKMNFSDYFLIVWDFMKFSREHDILTGPGRGSAAGSIVAYVLYITDVDPIKHQLLFERFLNPERISMPDIDIDFPDHRRDEVIEYVAKKYGPLHVAQIITFGTMATKAALRDVGRAFGLNPKELDQLSRLVPSKLGITLEGAYKEAESFRRFVNESETNRKLFKTALKLEGLPRHTSTHAAGVVISEQPLVNVIPIQAGHGEVHLTQYSMEHLEEVGLLKMDFLGLRNLSLIEQILKMIHKKTTDKLNIKNLPLNDPDVFHLLSRGETTGIFQLESEGMRKVLSRLKPTGFEDIVAVNALYRPGPMENIPTFIDRKHGKQQVSYPHPDLEDILKNTYGVIVYQEQIIEIASKFAGFSLGEADLLRRAVGKKKKEILDQERHHFVSGARKKGYDVKTADEIYDLIVRFANYGFNRSHAVAYSMIAYQLAYLKAHYPKYFMAALLSSITGTDVRISQYIRELKQMGIQILQPSINRSGYTFLVEKEGIRYSLSAIKGIGTTVLREIFQARKTKPFSDLFDFCMRISLKIVNRKILESLVNAGCFDEFGEDRAVLLASIDVAIEHAELVSPDESGQADLFSDEDFLLKPKYVKVDPISIEDKLNLEKEVLGLYLSSHPVSIYEKSLIQSGYLQLSELKRGNKKLRAGVYITEIKTIRTKKGEAMAFLTVSDSTGEIDAVAFPTVFNKFGSLMKKGMVVALEGKLEEREGKNQFVIQAIYSIEEIGKKAQLSSKTLYLKIDQSYQTNQQLLVLKEILQKYKGNIPVIIHYDGKEKSLLLSEQDYVKESEECLKELKEFLGVNNVILKD